MRMYNKAGQTVDKQGSIYPGCVDSRIFMTKAAIMAAFFV
jgi:hypothetical protein